MGTDQATLAGEIQRSLTIGNVVGIVVLALWSLLPPRLSEPAVDYWIIAVTNIVAVVTWTLLIHFVASPRVVRAVLRPAVGFLVDGRPPHEDEARALVAQPWRQAVRNYRWWPLAIVWEAALNAGLFYDPGEWPILRFSAAMLLAGYVGSLIGMVLVERRMRPVFAQAFEHAVVPLEPTQSVARRLLLLWGMVAAAPTAAVIVVVSGLDAEQMLQVRGAIQQLVVLCLLSGALATWIGTRSIIEPITDVSAAMRRVAAGDLDVEVAADRPGELGSLQAGFNHMVGELRYRRLLEALFRRHVGGAVAERVLSSGRRLEPERCDASLLFVRLHRPDRDRIDQEVIAAVNAALEVVVGAVAAESGWVNKLSEDGAMCVFGPLGNEDDHAAAALRVGRSLAVTLGRGAESSATIPLTVALGVATGPVVAGNVGAFDRHEFTVIGEAVNAAARLAEMASERTEYVLASGIAVAAAAGHERDRWHQLGDVVLRGWPAPTPVFAPLADELSALGPPQRVRT